LIGAGVDDEVARRAGRCDPVQLRLEPQRQHGLVFGVRVALDHERQRIEHGADDGGIVLAVRVGRDQRAHVEEAVRLAGLVAIDHRQVRPDRLCGIEGDRQREEQAARRGLERTVGAGKEPRDQDLERLLAVAKLFGHVGADRAGAIPCVELGHAVEKRRRAIQAGSRDFHRPHIVTVKR